MAESFIPKALEDRMTALGLYEEDFEEQFVLGSGAGGQKINKTHNCVRLVHLPSGREVRCQESRSREVNRLKAREILCEKLELAEEVRNLARAKARAVKRVQRRRLSPGEKRKKKEEKTRQSGKKSLRKKPGLE